MSQISSDRALCALAYTLCTLKNAGPCTGVRFSTLIQPAEDDFSLDGSTIRIQAPGVYLIRYSLFLPEGCALDSMFSVQANTEALLSSVVHVLRRPADPGATYSAQALAHFDTPARVLLISSAPLDIRDRCASTAASVSFLRVGEAGSSGFHSLPPEI